MTNAARTQLMALDTCDWHEPFFKYFSVRPSILPRITSNAEASQNNSYFGGGKERTKLQREAAHVNDHFKFKQFQNFVRESWLSTTLLSNDSWYYNGWQHKWQVQKARMKTP